MNKIYLTTDSNQILTATFSKDKANGDLKYILEEDKCKDNQYSKVQVLEMEYEGEIHTGENLVNIITVYGQAKKVFVNKVVAATQYRAEKEFDCEEEGKYKNEFFIVEV